MSENNTSSDIDSLWKNVLANIKRELSEQSYQTWIDPVSLHSVTAETVVLEVPDNFYSSWLREHYQDLIKTSFAVLTGAKPKIEYIVVALPEVKTTMSAKTPEAVDPAHVFSAPPPARLQQSIYDFENFVVGPSNRFSHAAALAVSESPAKNYNPLFIYGQVGLGKTHLLQAISSAAKKKNPNLKTLYITSEKFTNMLISSIQNRSTISFRQKFRNVDILLIDDIHFIAGKESTQEEFFHTFNDLYDTQKQIVLTSDRHPKEIPGLEERLVSRFEWGLVTDIQPPDFETRVAILKKKMERETVVVSDEVAFFIASNIKSNIRELEGALIRVVAYSSLIGQAITVDLVKNILKDSFTEEEKKINIDYIQKKTSDFFNISLSDMKTKKRNKSIAFPRQIAMYLVRSLTDHSLPEIGKYFGGRDHTTVLHAISKIEKDMGSDDRIKKLVDSLFNTIKRG